MKGRASTLIDESRRFYHLVDRYDRLNRKSIQQRLDQEDRPGFPRSMRNVALSRFGGKWDLHHSSPINPTSVGTMPISNGVSPKLRSPRKCSIKIFFLALSISLPGPWFNSNDARRRLASSTPKAALNIGVTGCQGVNMVNSSPTREDKVWFEFTTACTSEPSHTRYNTCRKILDQLSLDIQPLH